MLICLNFIGHVSAWLEKKPHQPLQIYFFSFPIFFLYFFFQFSYNFFKINFIFRHPSLFFLPNPEHSSLFFPQTQDNPPSLLISYSSLNLWCLCHLSFTATTRTALTATIISLDSTIKSIMGSLPLSKPLTQNKIRNKNPIINYHNCAKSGSHALETKPSWDFSSSSSSPMWIQIPIAPNLAP